MPRDLAKQLPDPYISAAPRRVRILYHQHIRFVLFAYASENREFAVRVVPYTPVDDLPPLKEYKSETAARGIDADDGPLVRDSRHEAMRRRDLFRHSRRAVLVRSPFAKRP